MKSAIAFRILYQPIPFFVSLPTVFHIVICLFGKIVLIDKIISRVIRRISKVFVFEGVSRVLCKSIQ